MNDRSTRTDEDTLTLPDAEIRPFSVEVPELFRMPVKISSDAATRMAAVRVIATMTTGDFIDVPSRCRLARAR